MTNSTFISAADRIMYLEAECTQSQKQVELNVLRVRNK